MNLSSPRILMIDDDIELCELVSEYLNAEGFRVDAIHNGVRGLAAAQAGEHALVILDVMLPGLNGLEVLRKLRAADCAVPVVMLTARGTDATDRIVGLEVGADDYIPKPFNPRELVARIRGVLRRYHATVQTDHPVARERLTVGAVSLDTGARLAKRDSETLILTAAEFDLLAALLRRAGEVVTRDQLMKAVLGRGLAAFDRTIDMHLSNLRKKLGPCGEYVRTVRSVGYMYALPGESGPTSNSGAAEV